MNISLLGTLHPDARIPEWLVSEPVSVPYFDGQRMTFTVDGLTEADREDVERALAAFFALGSDAKKVAAPFVFQNYRRMADVLDEDEVGCRITSPDGVWAHVHPSEIFVSRRHRRDHLIYIQITAECDWEREHGLQIIYRRGSELSRVSDQDGHLTHTDAYDVPEDKDKIA
ncbi:MAG: hypothetical protein ABJF10_12035 [Chthoniobacter sp.]|uniref:DUF6985 domain-containing protein n=1 Tax=Chthoniobacter sp. TaxID=2510640 RepID=UPI0032ABF815